MFDRLFGRRAPTIILDIESHSIDPMESIGKVVWMPAETPDTIANKLVRAGAVERLRNPGLLRTGAIHIRQLKAAVAEAKLKSADWQAKARIASEDAKDLTKRTEHAIREMRSHKSGAKQQEVPVAVILSPAQFNSLTYHRMFKQGKIGGVQIYIAKGVYGPVVLTQDGFNGFTRMAPELAIYQVPGK